MSIPRALRPHAVESHLVSLHPRALRPHASESHLMSIPTSSVAFLVVGRLAAAGRASEESLGSSLGAMEAQNSKCV